MTKEAIANMLLMTVQQSDRVARMFDANSLEEVDVWELAVKVMYMPQGACRQGDDMWPR